MKKRVFLFSFVLIGVLVLAINAGCEKDPVEACEQDLFCDGTKEVTACCVDNADCYYTYNGVEYPDTDKGLADLVTALGCGSAKSVSVNGGNTSMALQLQALLEQARKQSRR